MKKILLLLLLLLTVAAVAVACSESSENHSETEDQTTESEDESTSAETEASPLGNELLGWFDLGSALYYQDIFTPKEQDAITIAMAKNEIEGFQYILASGIDYEGLRCEVSDLTDGKGNTLTGTVNVAWSVGLRKTYSSYERGYVPFALLPQDDPFQGGSFAVQGGRSKTLYVEYRTTKDTVPGTYTGTLEIKQGDKVLKSGSVSVTVWDLYYEEQTAIRTVFGYGFSPMHPDNPEYVPVPEGAPPVRTDNGLTTPYADYLLDYRLSISALPSGGTLLDEEAEKYLDNPRVTDVCLSNQYKLDEQYQKAVERGWLDKIYFMQFDEPHQDIHVQTILNGAQGIAQRFPTTRHMNPLLGWSYYEGDKNIVDVLSEVTSLHCVKSSFYVKDIKDSLVRLKAERGDTVFWYTCGDQPYNMIDLLPCVPGNVKETLFWQLYQNNIDGYLCWSTTWWYYQDNIWEEGYDEKTIKFPPFGVGPTGMGVLLYWHPETNMPVSTLSLTATCDGIEDYQLFAMAEEVLGRETVLTYVERITTSPTDFTTDGNLLYTVRCELAEALLAAKAQ